MKYYEVAISRYPIQILTYVSEEEIEPGSRVIVQVRNKKHLGYTIKKSAKPAFDVKNISEIIDEKSLISENLLKLAIEASKLYISPVGEILDLCFPPSNIKGTRIKSQKKLYLTLKIPLSKILKLNLGQREMKVIEFLLEMDTIDYSTAVKQFSKANIQSLIEQGIIDAIDFEESKIHRRIKLTDIQKKIASDIFLNPSQSHLIYGITGSGKTEIYFEVADQVLKAGKKVLLLVPEITLTPQLLFRTKSRFADKKIVVYHSALGALRKAGWDQIIKGEVDILLGTRSAVWLPMKNIGLIVVDEEQDDSYKQYSMRPYYNAADMARRRAELDGAYFVLASATPKVETYYEAKNGQIKIHTIEDRPVGEIPSISVVDMRGIKGQILSQKLIDKMEKVAKDGNQTFLFVPQKGFASYVQCGDCGHILTCPNCDVSLVYHKRDGSMKCHYCGYVEPVPMICPVCGSTNLRKGGIGTERVENEVSKIFPGLRIKRMDRDEIKNISSIENALEEIGNLEVDIVVGTKMITKGLDFPKVALVGIVDADHSFGIPDFRANERTFQLLSQMGGRAGRGVKGEILIQTMEPENAVIKALISDKPEKFYESEIERRKALGYPPFKELILITSEAKSPDEAKNHAQKVKEILSGGPFNILGPVESPIFKLMSKYRFQILLKCDELNEAINFLEPKLKSATLGFDVIENLKIDVRPYSF